MRRSWLVGVAGAVLVGGLSTGVVLAAAGPDAADNVRPGAEQSGKAGENGRGHGPPPWAQAHGHDSDKDARAKGHGQARGQDKAWLDEWRDLTPRQREQRMRAYAQAHAEGMRDWAACVAEEGADRASCEKPLPPGQAKRQP